MSVVSGPVWSGEVAVQQRAINRGIESYHLPPTRQAKTRTNAGDSIASARQPDAGGRTARLRVSTQTAGLGTRRASPSTSRKHLLPDASRADLTDRGSRCLPKSPCQTRPLVWIMSGKVPANRNYTRLCWAPEDGDLIQSSRVRPIPWKRPANREVWLPYVR